MPREPTDETGNVFERKNAAKRNVATRQPARDVGLVLKDGFDLNFMLLLITAYISIGASVDNIYFSHYCTDDEIYFSSCSVLVFRFKAICFLNS